MLKQDFDSLTGLKQLVLFLLRKVAGKSPYAYECRKIDSIDKLDQMIKHFQDQMKVNPLLVKEIIGEAAFDAIKFLEEDEMLNGRKMAMGIA